MHLQVKELAVHFGISYNAALNVLVGEALEARGIPKEEG
jgi:hypothetical protein